MLYVAVLADFQEILLKNANPMNAYTMMTVELMKNASLKENARMYAQVPAELMLFAAR